MDSVVGIGGYACKDLQACKIRIEKRQNAAVFLTPMRFNN